MRSQPILFLILFIVNTTKAQEFKFTTVNDSLSVLVISKEHLVYVPGRYLIKDNTFYFSPVDSLHYTVSSISYKLNEDLSKDSIMVKVFITDPLEIGAFEIQDVYFKADNNLVINSELNSDDNFHRCIVKPINGQLVLSAFERNTFFKKDIPLFDGLVMQVENTNEVIIKCYSLQSLVTNLENTKKRMPKKVVVDGKKMSVVMLEFSENLNRLTIKEMQSL